MGEAEPVDLRRPAPGLAGTKDQEHNEGGSDNANDDVDQSRAGEAGSLLRWRDRGFHPRLDAMGL
jgi:hypothetical protein